MNKKMDLHEATGRIYDYLVFFLEGSDDVNDNEKRIEISKAIAKRLGFKEKVK